MATLVLSTVGSALGGPVGGAIGALIGQSIDQQLLAPARRGPRLGDLSVQTSSYGTQIPRIYGSMRVAGSVVWATDLVEGEQTGGAKGQPDITYSYSVSLAVALSSRPAGAIGRIWADGKLLRGADGDFKVPVTFRFHDGSESQEIDPLIASVEGIANTPAYRGLALAVFENLELAAFGNRIPFMTFEVVADAAPPPISAILADASDGSIAVDEDQALIGYAAYGQSVAAAVQPLVDCFDVPLFDDGTVLRGAVESMPIVIGPEELGSSGDGRNAARMQREQQPVRDVPSTLRLSYYDPARDYQAGEARAIAGELATNERREDLPAVLDADDAKTLVQQMLSRQWSRRDRLTLRLPPARIAVEPGAIIEPGTTPSAWRVEKSTIDGFAAVVELSPAWHPQSQLIGEPGRIVHNPDVVQVPISLALIDVPSAFNSMMSSPAILIAASSPSPGWTARTLTVTASGQTLTTQSATAKSVLGSTSSALADGDAYLVDLINSVEVGLIDPNQWLTSCDDDALADGANLAAIGAELVQFADVAPLGGGRFRLSRLLRGRGGTEWATASHEAGEIFCLVDSGSLRSAAVPAWARGSMMTVSGRDGSSASITFGAECVRPLSPVELSANLDAAGGLSLRWIRRSRNGFGWFDEIDAPIGESREHYSVSLASALSELEFDTDEPQLVIAAGDLATLGAGAAAVTVRQVGDWAASRPRQLTIELP
jgi:hypothetical protein